jgi:hypothetical protein
MRRSPLLLLILVGGSAMPTRPAGPPDSEPTVGIEVEVTADGALQVRLVNNGKEPLTVLTQGRTFRGGPREGVGLYDWEIVLGLPSVARHKGRVAVPAIAKYGPVTLMPGEVTEPITLPRDVLEEFYRTYPVPPPLARGETRVVYEVHPLWGKRFDLWDGKVTKKVMDGRIVEPSGGIRIKDR